MRYKTISLPFYFNTSNVTGRHRGLKWKLWAGHFCLLVGAESSSCGIAHFLCAMRVFEVRPSPSSPRLPLRQILFAELACGKNHVLNHSLSHSLSLFDVSGTYFCTVQFYCSVFTRIIFYVQQLFMLFGRMSTMPEWLIILSVWYRYTVTLHATNQCKWRMWSWTCQVQLVAEDLCVRKCRGFQRWSSSSRPTSCIHSHQYWLTRTASPFSRK